MNNLTLRKYLIILLLCISCKESRFTITPKFYEDKNVEISNKKLFDIEGVYTTDPNEIQKCNITLTIFLVDNNYNYKLKTTERNFSGDVLLKHTEKKDGYYITFKGIKWSTHEDSSVVDIDEDENQIKTEKLELPKGLDAVIYENEINFQNYGNSIDYYVKVEECERKFVQLKKQ